MPVHRPNVAGLPHLEGRRMVTDGGLETDLIFHRGVDLPDFAAFPLVETPEGRSLLADYYDGYAEIARAAGAGLMLESATWRANPDWGRRLGYSTPDLDRLNRTAIEHLVELRDGYRSLVQDVVISGMVGPRADGYAEGEGMSAAEAADYHLPQIRSLSSAGADVVSAYTLTDVDEAIGIVQAADAVGVPVAISFTVETDGRLPGGQSLAEAVSRVDAVAPATYFQVNCAHPTHIALGLTDPGGWQERLLGMRYNASARSHAELDEADELDEGDLGLLRSSHQQVAGSLPALRIVGGCCGTDARHVAALWGQ